MKHESFGIKVGTNKSRYERLWEPPLSCQRRPIVSSVISSSEKIRYQEFFPLELTNQDYFNRLISIIQQPFKRMIYDLHSFIENNFPTVSALEYRTLPYHQQNLKDRLKAISDLLNFEILFLLKSNEGIKTMEYIMDYWITSSLRSSDSNSQFTSFPLALCTLLYYESRITSNPVMNSSDLFNMDLLFQSALCLIQYFGIENYQPIISSHQETDNSILTKSSLTFQNQIIKDINQLKLRDDASEALNQIKQLQIQMNFHRNFKVQRMKFLGWNWNDAIPTAHGNNNFSNKLKQFGCMEGIEKIKLFYPTEEGITTSSTASYPDYELHSKVKDVIMTIDSIFDSLLTHPSEVMNLTLSSSIPTESVGEVYGLLQQSEEVKSTLLSFLQMETVARIQLIHRIECIAEDLHCLMKALSEDGDYEEARLLRKLCIAVQATIDENNQQLMDQVHETLHSVQGLLLSLQRTKDTLLQSSTEHSILQSIDTTTRDLQNHYHMLYANLGRFSILSEGDVIDKLSHQGPSFLTADYLFTFPHHTLDSQTIGGLVIKTKNELLLTAIRQWPGLTIIAPLKSPGPPNDRVLIRNDSAKLISSERFDNSISSRNIPPTTGRIPKKYFMSQGDNSQEDANYDENDNDGASSVSLSTAYQSNATVNILFNNFSLRNNNSNDRMVSNYPSDLPTNESRGDNVSMGHEYQAKEDLANSYEENGLDRPKPLNAIHVIQQSFEDLNHEMQQLVAPGAKALTALLCRLTGLSRDLITLSNICNTAGQFMESDRMLYLSDIIEKTIDADEEDAQSSPLTCGRGRIRLDNIHKLLAHVDDTVDELIRQIKKARGHGDYSEVQALEAMAFELDNHYREISAQMEPFSILNSDNADYNAALSESIFYSHQSIMKMIPPTKGTGSSHEINTFQSQPKSSPIEKNLGVSLRSMEINERIAREGTGFITSDYLFQYICGNQNQSVGSLAIIAGAGAMLRYIRSYWPNLTVLGHIAPVPMGDRMNNPQQSWIDPLQFTHHVSGSPSSFLYGHESIADAMHGHDANHNPFQTINFKNVNELRQIGFDPRTLRAAGFSDTDILTGGYSARELKQSGFNAAAMKKTGLSDFTIRQAGFQDIHELEVLVDLYVKTGGSLGNDIGNKKSMTSWRNDQGWLDLVKLHKKGDGLSKIFSPSTISNDGNYLLEEYQQKLSTFSAEFKPQNFSIHNLYGTKFDVTTGSLQKLVLNLNKLRGPIPESISTLTNLVTLNLSENNLTGSIPSSLGLLSNLETLLLSNNDLEGEIPNSLRGLLNLHVLRLDMNRISGGIPSALGSLTLLRRLDLSHNLLIGSIPGRLGNLVHLQELVLHNNQLTGALPDGLHRLQNLSSLLLHCNKLSGQIPGSYHRLKKLTIFNISNNEKFDVDRLLLQKALPKCKLKL